MHVPKAVHPVLAQRHWARLPPLPTLEGMSFDDGYLGAVGGEAHAPARSDEDAGDEVGAGRGGMRLVCRYNICVDTACGGSCGFPCGVCMYV